MSLISELNCSEPNIDVMIANFRTIFAFDLDARRAETMRRMCAKAGASCVQIASCDFLEVDAHDLKYANVEYVIVDPSCSGSGEHYGIFRSGYRPVTFTRMFEQRHNILSNVRTNVRKYVV